MKNWFRCGSWRRCCVVDARRSASGFCFDAVAVLTAFVDGEAPRVLRMSGCSAS